MNTPRIFSDPLGLRDPVKRMEVIRAAAARRNAQEEKRIARRLNSYR